MFNKTTAAIALTLMSGLTAQADFSYSRSQKATGGSMAAMAGTANSDGKSYFKGQKMATTSIAAGLTTLETESDRVVKRICLYQSLWEKANYRDLRLEMRRGIKP